MWINRLAGAHAQALKVMKAKHEKEVSLRGSIVSREMTLVLQLLMFMRNSVLDLPERDVVVHSLRTHAIMIGGHHAVHISDMHTESKLTRINCMKNKIIAKHEAEEFHLELSVR
jgi:hypothetical protein